MAVTMQDIAQKAGVSRGTVDRALNHRGRINPEVAEKIEKIAKELGYIHRTRKRRNTGNRKVRIGIITQLSKAAFMSEINRGIRTAQKELERHGTEVILREQTDVDEKKQIQQINELMERKIDGLAIMPIDSEPVRAKLNQMISGENIPVVTFNTDIVGTGRVCFTGMDNYKSGRVAAGLMEMLTRGKGKVLVITGHFSSLLNNQRVDGFVEELKKLSDDLEIAGVQASFDEKEEVKKIITNTMMNISGINGIFIVSSGQEGLREAFDELCLQQRPYVIAYDRTPKNEKMLEENLIDFLIDQNGFEQGYGPPILLEGILSGSGNPKKENLYTDISIKTKYNL